MFNQIKTQTSLFLFTIIGSLFLQTGIAFAQSTVNVSTQINSSSGTSALLQGSVAGDHISTLWSQLCGPSTANIASPSTWWTQVEGLNPGVYKFKLRALGHSNAELGSSTLVVNSGAAFAGRTECTSTDTTTTTTTTTTPTADANPTTTTNTTPTVDTTNTTTATNNSGVTVSTAVNGGPLSVTADKALLQGSVNGPHNATAWSQICGPNTANVSSPSTWWSWVENLIPGVYLFKLKAIGNGNTELASSILRVAVGSLLTYSTDCSSATITSTADATSPAVVSVTSSATNGTYVTGNQIPIRVTFSEPVLVTGIPQLLLETGSTNTSAVYSSGSGSNELLFIYTVQTSDKSSDLQYANINALSAGTVKDMAGNVANLNLPALSSLQSLGGSKDLVINPVVVNPVETDKPFVTKVTSRNPNGIYKTGTITVSVKFNKPVTVTGNPTLTLETGNTDAVAQYVSGSNTAFLKFTYTIQNGHNSPDLEYVNANALSLNGGSIKSASGIDVNIVLPQPGTSGSLSVSKDIVIETESSDNDDNNACTINCASLTDVRLIPLTANMLINEYANGDESLLVDEQTKFSLKSDGSVASSFPQYTNCNYRAVTNDFDCFNPNVTIRQKAIDPNKDAKSSIIIDLGAPVQLKSINFFDVYGEGPVQTSKEGTKSAVEIYAGGPLVFDTLVGTTNLTGQDSITAVPAAATVRYVKLVFRGNVMTREIALVGRYISQPESPMSFTKTTKISQKTFDEMTGVNLAFGMGISHNPSNPSTYTYYDDEFKNNRHYTSFHWRLDKSDNVIPLNEEITIGAMNRIKAKGGSFFNTMTGASWSMVNPATSLDPNSYFFRFQKAIPYTLCSSADTKQTEGGVFPYCNNDAIAEKPSSYALRGHLAGKAAAADKAQGLTEIELGNEADGFWHETGYYRPFELAAQTSVDYDGHCSTVTYNGQNIGVKNMAGGMRVLMPALAFPDPSYMKAVFYWYKHARGSVNGCKEIPVDATNIHYYANNTPGLLAGLENDTHGVSPEEWDLEEKIGKPLAVHNAFAPQNDFLVTEFGYDTCPNGSQERVPELGQFTRYQVHGMWLVRTLLLLSKIGVDNADIFWLADQNKKSSSYCFIFTESGLLELKQAWNETGSNKPLYVPKDGWYYVVATKRILTGYRYSTSANLTTTTGKPARSQTYTKGASKVYVLWLPSSTGATGQTASLSVPTGQNYKVYGLEYGFENGKLLTSGVSNGTVTVNQISEKPVFVVVE